MIKFLIAVLLATVVPLLSTAAVAGVANPNQIAANHPDHSENLENFHVF